MWRTRSRWFVLSKYPYTLIRYNLIRNLHSGSLGSHYFSQHSTAVILYCKECFISRCRMIWFLQSWILTLGIHFPEFHLPLSTSYSDSCRKGRRIHSALGFCCTCQQYLAINTANFIIKIYVFYFSYFIMLQLYNIATFLCFFFFAPMVVYNNSFNFYAKYGSVKAIHSSQAILILTFIWK